MRQIITNDDLSLITNKTMNLSLKIEVLKESKAILSIITGNIINATFNIDANSENRRSCELEVLPDEKSNIMLKEDGIFWLNRILKIYMGIKCNDGTIMWYSQGCYYISDADVSFDATNNILKLSCSDYMVTLNGIKNGNIGALKTTIPAYIEDKETGEVLRHNTIKEVMNQVIKQTTHVDKFIVDDVGEFKAMPEHNKNWAKYREEHPLWNALPNDLEFDAGCTVFSILSELKDIYPNFEMFFDVLGTLLVQMIPTCYADDVVFSDDFLRKIILSEDFSVDMNTIRNMCMVWGKTIDTDHFSETSTYIDNVYSITIDKYEKYSIGDKVSFKVLTNNEINCSIKINDLKAIPVYDEVTGTIIDKDKMESGKIYVFKLKYMSKDNKENMIAYLQGQWQAHALNVLVDGTDSKEYHTLPDGNKVLKYSEDYFKNVYNCDTVSLTVIPNSPFTVQKLGEILDVKTGEEYSNIPSDAFALTRAEYENWKNCRLKDSITINTKITPFADVNVKCSYQRSDMQTAEQYIVKSISHNILDGTTTWNMCKFYPLYQDTLDAIGTHKTLSEFKQGTLGKYTFEQLAMFVPGEVY